MSEELTNAKLFAIELQSLLKKYNVDLSAEDEWEGYSECGQDIRIRAYSPVVYDKDGDCIWQQINIDFGRYIDYGSVFKIDD